jgi:hypothetical protein
MLKKLVVVTIVLMLMSCGKKSETIIVLSDSTIVKDSVKVDSLVIDTLKVDSTKTE